MRNFITIALSLTTLLCLGCSLGGSMSSGKFKVGEKVPSIQNINYLQGPESTLTDPDNQTIHLIEFWATWCPPCRDSAPHLSAIQKQYPDLRVIGISDEDENTVKPFLAKGDANMSYTIALDPNGQLMTAYGITGIPAAFLVDAKGNLLWSGHPMDGALTSQLKKHMAKTK